MASPQIDDGYTRIANELMEALIRAELPAVQTRIVLIIMRETYGWKRKIVRVGYQALSTRYGIGRTLLIREMATLVDRKVLVKGSEDSVNTWGIQKDYTQWLPSHSTDTSHRGDTSHQNGQRLVTPERPVTSHSAETTSKKVKEIKENTGDARETPPPGDWIALRLGEYGIADVQAGKVIAAFRNTRHELTPSDLDRVDTYMADHQHTVGMLLGSWLYKAKLPPGPRTNGHTNGRSPPQPELHEAFDDDGNFLYLALPDGTRYEAP